MTGLLAKLYRQYIPKSFKRIITNVTISDRVIDKTIPLI